VKKTILAIDDDAALLVTLTDILEEAGYKTIALADPLQTEKYIEMYDPDLLLIDIFMPDRTGFNLIEDFREKGVYLEIPKIFLTCLDDDVEKMTARACGVERYITKPFEPEELIACIKEILGENTEG
jgi:DNA-binding response OmpR family regulator